MNRSLSNSYKKVSIDQKFWWNFLNLMTLTNYKKKIVSPIHAFKKDLLLNLFLK